VVEMGFISGVNPKLAVRMDNAPIRSECGIGAMMSWAERLWFVTFVAHTRRSGSGTGLYYIDENLNMVKHPESVVGTYANRWVHSASDQVILGPHLIDAAGNVRTVPDLVDHRLTATMDHHEDIVNKVSYLTMEGQVLELDLRTLAVREVHNLVRELRLPPGTQPHFKGGYTSGRNVIVANNSYDERDYNGEWTGGLLAEFDGESWSILERTGSMEVFGRRNFGHVIYATGWDRASAYLRVKVNGVWSKYRLPKGSAGYEHFWSMEWTRIRELEHERYIADISGIFYEIGLIAWNGQIWGVRPISTHLRVVPDFTLYRGLLVLGGNQLSSQMELDWWRDDRSKIEGTDTGTALGLEHRIDANPLAGQSQVGLWFGTTDDLWTKFGKPKGWGGVWYEDRIEAGVASDPFLMTGFDKKTLHLKHRGDSSIDFLVEVDFLGNGSWSSYETVSVPANGYRHHVFPEGFSAHWVRVTASAACTGSAYFHYT
jgi:hypothetical protein